jgi:hypothetical protein
MLIIINNIMSTENIRTEDNYNVSSQDLKKNFKYSDKDSYDIFQDIKNKKVHRVVYSILMFMFLVITYIVIIMKKPKNTTPIFLYILYGIFAVFFYFNYFKLSVLITDFILLFYIPIDLPKFLNFLN